MDHSSTFQILPPRLGSMTGIWRRQVTDIVVIVHFLLFFLFFPLHHPPPLTCLHPTPTLTLTHLLLIIVHQKQGPITPLTPTHTRDQLSLHHFLCTSVNENLNQPFHSIKSVLCTILNLLKALFLSALN